MLPVSLVVVCVMPPCAVPPCKACFVEVSFMQTVFLPFLYPGHRLQNSSFVPSCPPPATPHNWRAEATTAMLLELINSLVICYVRPRFPRFSTPISLHRTPHSTILTTGTDIHRIPSICSAPRPPLRGPAPPPLHRIPCRSPHLNRPDLLQLCPV